MTVMAIVSTMLHASARLIDPKNCDRIASGSSSPRLARCRLDLMAFRVLHALIE